MNNFLFRGTILLCVFAASVCKAQKTETFNLKKLLNDGKLVIYPNQNVTALTDGSRQGVTCQGIVWLKGISFSTGSIDVDIRGRDVAGQSFVGIAFHGIDTITYDGLYFRPFNFQSGDTLKRKHCVQYISPPDYSWDRLRREHPLVYENAVNPSLMPSDWFHARIVVTAHEITVYVNNSAVPSLKVKKLNSRDNGLIGFWSSDLSGDFANLQIKND
jgi:hypothetical protein